MKEIAVKIKLLSPAVISDSGVSGVLSSSQDSISGTIVRGIFASEYICRNQLGSKAHEDEAFQELFYGGLRFLPAALWDEASGNSAVKIPLCLQKSKLGKDIRDLMYENPKPGFKGFKGYGVIFDGQIKTVKPQKNITLHVSRNPHDDKDGSIRLAGKSLDGNVYNYESLDAGQVFVSSVVGSEEGLLRLRELFSQPFVTYLGKSRYTQYGSCQVELGEIRDVVLPSEAVAEDSIILRLASPYIPPACCMEQAEGEVDKLLWDIRRATDDMAWEKGRVFAAEECIDNFVGVWHMRRPRSKALAAGTVIELKKSGGIGAEDVQRLAQAGYTGIGIRCQEGFGQLRIWPKQVLKVAEIEAGTLNREMSAVTSNQVKSKALDIMQGKLLERVRNLAYEHAKKAKIPSEATHALSRMSEILGDEPASSGWYSAELAGMFALELRKEFKDEKYFYNINVAGRRFVQWLMNSQEEAPYTEMVRAFCEDNKVEDICRVLSKSEVYAGNLAKCDAVFYTYYHWLLRHMRKENNKRGG